MQTRLNQLCFLGFIGRAVRVIASQWIAQAFLQISCLCLACWPGLGPAADSLSGVPESKQRTRPHCPRPRSRAAGQPVSWHLRGAPQNSTSRRRRCARTTAASQMTKWLCPAAQPPPRKHHATGAATRGSGYLSGHRCAWPALQRFSSSQHSRGGLLPLIPCQHAKQKHVV